MAVDYDQVIIGASKVGIYMARKAALLQARVALVTQGIDLTSHYTVGDRLSEIGQENYLANRLISRSKIDLATAQQQIEGIEAFRPQKYALANLAALGVDVIAERGEFCRLPKLAFQTTKRKLRIA